MDKTEAKFRIKHVIRTLLNQNMDATTITDIIQDAVEDILIEDAAKIEG